MKYRRTLGVECDMDLVYREGEGESNLRGEAGKWQKPVGVNREKDWLCQEYSDYNFRLNTTKSVLHLIYEHENIL